MNNKQAALFENRFLESYTGTSLIKEPKVAIMELVANSWDAGASKVQIHWPLENGDRFSIIDNGHGMTEANFDKRFRTLAYNRAAHQGLYAEIPKDNSKISKRPVFGRNGKGRFAGFSFGESFFVRTWRDGKENTFRVSLDNKNALFFQKVGDTNQKDGHGTEIYVSKSVKPLLSDSDIRTEISMRFMTDPDFEVSVNEIKITFSDIPKENVESFDVTVPDYGILKVTVIDVQNSDRTTQQHGIAWHVNRRLVGECTWKGSGNEHLVDGRKAVAKRYTFIVEANFLKDHDAVLPDWTGFYPNNKAFLASFSEAQDSIKSHILQLSKESRKATFNEIRQANTQVLKTVGIIGRERWEKFVETIQEECPSITDDDLQRLATVLATLENSESKFNLINQLSEYDSKNLDDLNKILDKWSIDLAKIVLDELEYRLKLIEQLRIKVKSELTDEVQDLQPLFHRGLWIFGPEYETIEYTSNEGMSAVIQKIFGISEKGRPIRPDFVIVPDGTVGFYGYPFYDDNGGELGIDKLTIVELKKPGIRISKEEKDQPLKYIEELTDKGLIKNFTTITCFVLGSEVNNFYSGKSTHNDDKIKNFPLDYDTILNRAQSRVLNLYKRVSNAPFLQDTRINEFIKQKEQLELWNIVEQKRRIVVVGQ